MVVCRDVVPFIVVRSERCGLRWIGVFHYGAAKAPAQIEHGEASLATRVVGSGPNLWALSAIE